MKNNNYDNVNFFLITATFLVQSCAKIYYTPDARTLASTHKILAKVPLKVSIAGRRKVYGVGFQNVGLLSPTDLSKILNVEVVLIFNYSLSKPISEGAAIAMLVLAGWRLRQFLLYNFIYNFYIKKYEN